MGNFVQFRCIFQFTYDGNDGNKIYNEKRNQNKTLIKMKVTCIYKK